VWSAAFSPDGGAIVSASRDKTVKIWDARTGRLLHTLEGHTNGVFSAAFSPDGGAIVSASVDKAVKIWAVAGEMR
jgi:WD40 repeat protein